MGIGWWKGELGVNGKTASIGTFGTDRHNHHNNCCDRNQSLAIEDYASRDYWYRIWHKTDGTGRYANREDRLMQETYEKIPVLKIGDFLITSIQVALHDKLALSLQDDILNKIQETNAKGLIIDVTTIDVLDSFITRVLVEIAKMANIMGVKTVLVGLQPAIAITLVEFGMELTGMHTSLNLEKGLEMLKELVKENEV